MITLSSILRQSGNFINASEAHKGAFICWMAVPIYTMVLLWCLLTLWAGHYFPAFYYPTMVPLAIWSGMLVPALFFLGIYHLSLRDQPRHSRRYTFVVLYFYTITTMITCFLLGPLSIFAGLVLMGSPLIGMMLMPVRHIASAVVVGLLFALLLFLLVHAGWLPNQPLFHDQQSGYLTLCMTVGALYYTLYEAALMASLINAWQHRESGVRQLSLTDSLTSVANRRRILELLELEFTHRRRTDQYLGVIMVDIDHFKSINDNHGHQVGDQVLQEAAKALRNCLRQQDHIGRYGGEEFLIILPATPPAQAAHIAERCRRAIADLKSASVSSLILTASLGVTSHLRQQVSDMETLIQQADNAMYEAKKCGRNRVVSHESLKAVS